MIKPSISSQHRRRRAQESGAAVVEFVIALPLFILLVIGVTDYGALMNTAASLLGATRAGAEYAKANWFTDASNVTNTQTQVCKFSGLTFASGSCSPITTLSTTQSCTCADGTSVTCPTSTGTNPCSARTDTRVLVYVTVGATQSYQAWLAPVALPQIGDPSLTVPNSVSAQSVVRLQ